MIEIKPPTSFKENRKFKVFLAGSIEMGMAENWQEKVVNELKEYDIVFLNPRRDDWDSKLVQSINEPKFKEQVTWEIDGIEESNIVIFYFQPHTKSPITLMELGLVANDFKHVIVCCPDGFWRKGNVEVVCERYGIKLFETIDELIYELKWKITQILDNVWQK